jgi:hypothetical protein
MDVGAVDYCRSDQPAHPNKAQRCRAKTPGAGWRRQHELAGPVSVWFHLLSRIGGWPAAISSESDLISIFVWRHHMKLERILALILGLGLIAVGAISLAGNLFLRLEAWRLWPVVVILLGLGLTAPGLWGFSKRGLGSFFIPGLPVLTTGFILLAASLFNRWQIWAYAWPLEVLALALGFTLAAIFMRLPALAIPAFIIGANGLLLAFCSLTGLWQAWALLWPVEPLSVGLGLLVLSIFNKSRGTRVAAVVLFLVAGAGFFMTSFISVFNFSILRFGAPLMLILTGVLLASLSFLKREESAPAAVAPEPVEPVVPMELSTQEQL